MDQMQQRLAGVRAAAGRRDRVDHRPEDPRIGQRPLALLWRQLLPRQTKADEVRDARPLVRVEADPAAADPVVERFRQVVGHRDRW